MSTLLRLVVLILVVLILVVESEVVDVMSMSLLLLTGRVDEDSVLVILVQLLSVVGPGVRVKLGLLTESIKEIKN